MCCPWCRCTAARFLIARDESGKIVGFAHFRFTLHGELADVMEGSPCLFVYDVHISEGVQRKGLGRHLLTMLELIARKGNMYEMVMPVPKSDLAEGATAFALGGLKGWALDDLSEVAPKTARAIAEDGSLSVYVKVPTPPPSPFFFFRELTDRTAAIAGHARNAERCTVGHWDVDPAACPVVFVPT